MAAKIQNRSVRVNKILQKSCYSLRINYAIDFNVQYLLACLRGILFGGNGVFTKISYFVPVWPPKFKISDNVEKSSEKLL